jgi:4-amino-4-deoxy-L-arabinose transferase-like glycosyltransferase
VAAGSVVDGRWEAAGLAVLSGALYAIRLNEPGWFDNEGRFAEAAREMVVGGDWVTPRVNGVALLTKPPLTQWLAALVFRVAGPTEWARIVPVACAVATIVLTCRLGARLYDARTGLIAGLMLATTTGFVLEARTLRPDCLVILAVVATIWCWHVADTGMARPRTGWLVAMYAVAGLGMLAKGFVPVVLAAAPIGFATLRAHGVRGVGRLRPWLGLAVFAAVALPWHLAAALANPGFAWNYVVNEHILFAFDKKEPRDSEGDTLAFFLQMFVGRGAPWVLFAPFALRDLWGNARNDATVLLLVWIVAVLGIFSLTPSRLEHYSLPALPAVALLAARACRTAAMGAGLRLWTGAVGMALLAGGAFGLRAGHALAADAYWMLQAPGLMALVTPGAIVACWAGTLFLLAAVARSARAVVGAGVVGIAPFLVVLVRALIEAESLFSWRPTAQSIAGVPQTTEVVFEAPIEYQIVGGLDFYLGRSVTMLEPPGGYTPPTYLEGRTKGLFITRDALDRRWTSGRPVAIVSDPQRRRDTPDGLVPPPFHVLDRFGDRWILTNFPVSSAR